MFDDVAQLINVTTTTDEYGNTVETEDTHTVFVEPRSVYRSEYYQAGAVGLRPDLVLAVASKYDYNGERRIRYKSKVYDIIKTYINGSLIELTVTERGAHNADNG